MIGVGGLRGARGEIAVIHLEPVGAVAPATGHPYPCGRGVVGRRGAAHSRSVRGEGVDYGGQAAGIGPVAGFVTLLNVESVGPVLQGRFRRVAGFVGLRGPGAEIAVVQLVPVEADTVAETRGPGPGGGVVAGKAAAAYHRGVGRGGVHRDDEAGRVRPVARVVLLLDVERVRAFGQTASRDVTGIRGLGGPAGKVAVIKLVAVGAVAAAEIEVCVVEPGAGETRVQYSGGVKRLLDQVQTVVPGRLVGVTDVVEDSRHVPCFGRVQSPLDHVSEQLLIGVHRVGAFRLVNHLEIGAEEKHLAGAVLHADHGRLPLLLDSRVLIGGQDLGPLGKVREVGAAAVPQVPREGR